MQVAIFPVSSLYHTVYITLFSQALIQQRKAGYEPRNEVIVYVLLNSILVTVSPKFCIVMLLCSIFFVHNKALHVAHYNEVLLAVNGYKMSYYQYSGSNQK